MIDYLLGVITGVVVFWLIQKIYNGIKDWMIK